jgi:hypothetical protein
MARRIAPILGLGRPIEVAGRKAEAREVAARVAAL